MEKSVSAVDFVFESLWLYPYMCVIIPHQKFVLKKSHVGNQIFALIMQLDEDC